MRFLLAILVLEVTALGAAEAQQPSPPASSHSVPPAVKSYLQGAPPTVDELEQLPLGAMVSMEDDKGGSCLMSVISAIGMIKQTGRRFSCPAISKPDPPCEQAEAEIGAEKRKSDDHLHEMEKRGEIVTVLQQYEQEMYYEDRKAKLYRKFCQKPAPPVEGPTISMRTKICAASPAGCKPVKHW